MAKESYVSILGLAKGKSVELLATVGDKSTANWHINNTFQTEQYKHLITKVVGKKGDKYVPDVIAKDKGKYLRYETAMSTYDWDTLEAKVSEGTLLGFSEVVDPRGIKNEKAVGRLGSVYHADTDEEGKVTKFGLDVIIPETEPFPYTKVINALRKDVIEYLTGEMVETDDTVASEDSEDLTVDTGVDDSAEDVNTDGGVDSEDELGSNEEEVEVEENPVTKKEEKANSKKDTKTKDKKEEAKPEPNAAQESAQEDEVVDLADESEPQDDGDDFDFDFGDEDETGNNQSVEDEVAATTEEGEDPFEMLDEVEDGDPVVTDDEPEVTDNDGLVEDDFDFDFDGIGEDDESKQEGSSEVEDIEDFDIDEELANLDE